jgi:ABC-2 type transport system permease protein
VRWLLLKDLQILRRSPLLVALLVLYPVVVSLLIGFALSRGPERPQVAFLNEVSPAAETISVGGDSFDVTEYADRLFEAIDPVRVSSREEALEKVRSGDVLGALILPADVTQKLQSTIALGGSDDPPTVEVIYNREGPLQGQLVDSLISSRLAEANQALSGELTKVAAGYLEILLQGGSFSLLGQSFDVLGLTRSQSILAARIAQLPADDPARGQLEEVRRFAELAVDNLDLSGPVLNSIGSPVQVETTVLSGSSTPLDDFAVAVAVAISLMFVCVLLAAGMLALEREEHAFTRLVRGLVSRTGLLVEKAGLAALCAFLVTALMLVVVGAFTGLDYARAPQWAAALAAGALAFGALGVALGSLAREVRAASLLAFLLTLPLAFLALVPSGAVSGGLFAVIEVVSALFPFKPTLQALDAALNDADPGLARPVAHLLALALAFGALARVALRRFA